jgi:homoserine dehydrogenase
MTLELILVGFGNVARRFASLLDERRARLAGEHDLDIRTVGIVTRRHGHAFAARGLDAAALANRVARGGPLVASRPSGDRSASSSVDFIRDAIDRRARTAYERCLVMVETTTLNILSGEPAIAHVRAALGGGAHVVTANKGPAAFAYHALARMSHRADRRFLFEGAVMDGVPVFNLAREALPGIEVLGFRGVVNTTTNYMLNAMEQGQAFDEALVEMQAMGVAEADASLDIDGWDAAAKTAALANVLMDASLTPQRVERRGITRDLMHRAIDARRAGRRLKLVARAGYEGSKITARVAPEELPGDDLLASLDGQQNALILHTDLLGEIAIVQRSGGLTQTAYALLSDLITIARDVGTARATPQPRPRAPRGRSR